MTPESKILTITTKYKATKQTCRYVKENMSVENFHRLDFYDPQDKEIHAICQCISWFEDQRPSKIVWTLEEIEVDKHRWEET